MTKIMRINNCRTWAVWGAASSSVADMKTGNKKLTHICCYTPQKTVQEWLKLAVSYDVKGQSLRKAEKDCAV